MDQLIRMIKNGMDVASKKKKKKKLFIFTNSLYFTKGLNFSHGDHKVSLF